MHKYLTIGTMVAAVMSGLAAGGCGGDDSGSKDDTPSGASGRAAAGASGGAGTTVMCGSSKCEPPDASGAVVACCLDPFTSTCGTSKPGGTCATAQATGDPRCPSVDIMMGVMLPSCCTDAGQCGIDPTMFGSTGCVDLAMAASMAKAMGGANIAFPEPRACADSQK